MCENNRARTGRDGVLCASRLKEVWKMGKTLKVKKKQKKKKVLLGRKQKGVFRWVSGTGLSLWPPRLPSAKQKLRICPK